MTRFRIHHIHVKAQDPKEIADWYVKAFGFEIVSDDVRSFGDRFIRCKVADSDLMFMISGPRTGEVLNPADGDARLGLEHFGLQCKDIDADIAHLTGLGAELVEGPVAMPGGVQIAFLKAPGEVRIELLSIPS